MKEREQNKNQTKILLAIYKQNMIQNKIKLDYESTEEKNEKYMIEELCNKTFTPMKKRVKWKTNLPQDLQDLQTKL